MPMPFGRHDLQAASELIIFRRDWSGFRALTASFSRLSELFIRAEVATFFPYCIIFSSYIFTVIIIPAAGGSIRRLRKLDPKILRLMGQESADVQLYLQ